MAANEVTVTVTVRFSNGEEPTITVVTDPGPGASKPGIRSDVQERLDTAAPPVLREPLTAFLQRATDELGVVLALPSTGDRPYVNLLPPAGVRGPRLASLNLTSGRLALKGLPPDRVDEWTYAEIVPINQIADHLRIYIKADALETRLRDGLSMVKTVLDER